jgi:hypothetical protein
MEVEIRGGGGGIEKRRSRSKRDRGPRQSRDKGRSEGDIASTVCY